MIKVKNIYSVTGLLIIFIMLLTIGCSVHEWPELPEKVPHLIHLKFDTDMPVQRIEAETRSEKNNDEPDIRYIVRVFPVVSNGNTSQEYIDQIVFTKEITDKYDHSFLCELPPGNYTVRVWADFVKKGSTDDYLYDTTNFGEISLIDPHHANSDSRDAFRGSKDVAIVADFTVHEPKETTVEMIRPVAKFEIITTDLQDFISRETKNIATRNNLDDTKDIIVNLDDYRLVFHYVGFMPDVFSLITDKPVDSSTGVYFSSLLTQINNTVASMGFDYVFVNGNESVITVVIGIFNKEGEQLGMTAAIDVPVNQGKHTIVEGKFLLEENKGGVSINPDFDGDYDLIFP